VWPEGAVPLDELLGETGPEAALPEVTLSPGDPATIFYTSGTTGRPKGALGTHRNVGQAPMTVAYSILRTGVQAGHDPAVISGQRRVTLLAVPLFHVTGCYAALLTTLFTGNTLVLMYRWDATEALRLIEREKVTGVTGVPTSAWQLLSHPDLHAYDLSTLRTVQYGGAPAPPRLRERISETLPDRTATNGYGMTETTSLVIHNAGHSYAEHPDSIGTPLPVVDVRITRPDGTEAAPGEVGELCLRGASIVAGYWNRPEATRQTFSGGWLHTGDLAKVDADGFVYVVDRAKDMVIRGGENVYCAEVEAALFEHPAVEDAAVIGVPHDELGEEVGAVIRPVAGADPRPEELTAFLRDRPAAFKIPAHYWIRAAELPRNPGGKVLKALLRRELLERAEQHN
jgi:long-chain acyl-CoA synthetase